MCGFQRSARLAAETTRSPVSETPFGSRRGRWPPRGRRRGGYPSCRRRGGPWSRACRGRSGSARSPRPPFGPDAQAVDAGAAPVDGRLVAQPVQQPRVQLLPDAGRLPVAEPSPAGRAAAAAELLRQQPPGASCAQDEDDTAKGSPVGDARSTALGLGRLLRQQRGDGFPEVLRDKRVGHSGDEVCHAPPGIESRSKWDPVRRFQCHPPRATDSN